MPNQSVHPSSLDSISSAARLPGPLILRGEGLTIADVVRVAREGRRVILTDEAEVRRRVDASCHYITKAATAGERIYGVTTGFGGMANVSVSTEEATELQSNLLWFLKAGAGKRLPTADVRAAMLLRANSHLRGALAFAGNLSSVS